MGVLPPNRMGGIKEESEGEGGTRRERERERYSMAAAAVAIFCEWLWPRLGSSRTKWVGGVKRDLALANTLHVMCTYLESLQC